MKKIKKYFVGLYNLFLWKKQRKRYHRSVETLSIGAWWRIKETSDFSWLDKDFRGIEDFTSESYAIFEEVENSFIKLVGIGKDSEKMIRLKLKLHALLCKRFETGKIHIDNLIVIQEGKIKDLKKKISSGHNISNEESIITLEENMNMRFDPFEVTVKKYNDLVDYWTKRFKTAV